MRRVSTCWLVEGSLSAVEERGGGIYDTGHHNSPRAVELLRRGVVRGLSIAERAWRDQQLLWRYHRLVAEHGRSTTLL